MALDNPHHKLNISSYLYESFDTNLASINENFRHSSPLLIISSSAMLTKQINNTEETP
jgi:hypothetical protein